MKWNGDNGFAVTMTCRRDSITPDIPGQYLNNKKTYSSQRTKADIFFNPVVSVISVFKVK